MSESDESQVLGRFQEVLELFAQSKTHIKNDCYLEKILTHLDTLDDPRVFRTGVDWIRNIIHSPPHPSILAFAVRYASLSLQKDSSLLGSLLESQTLERLMSVSTVSPSVEISFIQVMRQAIESSAGIEWAISQKVWLKVIGYENPKVTVFMIREATCFLHEFLLKIQENRELSLDVLRDFLRPLIDRIWMNSEKLLIDVDNTEAIRVIYKMLKLMEGIYMRVIEHPNLSYIPYYFFTLSVQRLTWRLIDFALEPDITRQIMHVATIANYMQLTCLKIPDENPENMEPLSFNKFGINLYNSFNFAFRCRNVEMAIKAVETTHNLLFHVGTRRYPEENMTHQDSNFADQLFLLLICPALHVITEKNEEAFYSSMYDRVSEQTVKLLYGLRDVLDTTKKDKTDIAVKGIQIVALSSTVFSRERAIFMFEKLYETLLHFVWPPEVGATGMAILNYDNPRLLLVTLHALNATLMRYRFTRFDLEINKDVFSATIYLLNVPGLSTKIVAEAVKFARLSIENFLPPEQVLENLMNTVFRKLHDPEWEVRDSVLEFLTFIVDFALKTYESFTTQILELNLCTTVMGIAVWDGECFVRASALRCIRSMIRVKKLVNEAFVSMELINQICALLANEAEAIVRREAVETLLAAYLIQKSKLETILPSMVYCAAVDLHWEVRLQALEFWRMTLEQTFARHGMMDGSFPPHFFSAELKKIVTLNEVEIQKRISKALNEFGEMGGFGVLLSNLDETADLEVVKVAVDIIGSLNVKLEKYKFEVKQSETGLKRNLSSEDEEEKVEEASEGPEPSSETVLDQIVNDRDVNLLVRAHENALNNLHLNQRYDSNICEKFVRVRTEAFFAKLATLNLQVLVADRELWMSETESFESLLDDVIASFRDSGINDMDCY